MRVQVQSASAWHTETSRAEEEDMLVESCSTTGIPMDTGTGAPGLAHRLAARTVTGRSRSREMQARKPRLEPTVGFSPAWRRDLATPPRPPLLAQQSLAASGVDPESVEEPLGWPWRWKGASCAPQRRFVYCFDYC